MHTRVIRNDNDHAAVNARIRCRIERVCRNVQADMLHARHAARTGDGRAKSYLYGHLLVRRSLAVDFRVIRYIFVDLRTGRSGISARYSNACLVCTSGDRLVAKH